MRTFSGILFVLLTVVTVLGGCQGSGSDVGFAISDTALPEGEAGTGFSVTLTAYAGKEPYTWTDVNGTLADYGLVLDRATGEIKGTPTGATPSGGVPVRIRVQDDASPSRSVEKEFTLVIWPELRITTVSLPDGYDGQSGYGVVLTASGGKSGATRTWSLAAGSLPSNLSLSQDGQLGGDTTQGTAGDYFLVIQVSDGIGSKMKSFTLRILNPLRISTTSLADATESVSYSHTVQGTGGDSANYQWSASGLPSGLAIDSSTGEISGTPASGTAGTHQVSVTLSDGLQTAKRQFNLVVQTPTAPQADFEASPTYGTASLTVSFSDNSTGTVTGWSWDFDNDGTEDSTEQNPTHTYTARGWYTVKLTVTGPAGTDTCTKTKYVLVAEHIYYVDDAEGDDNNGGTSWSDAWKTIGHALSQAEDYDLVFVAGGLYKSGGNRNMSFGGHEVYLMGVSHHFNGRPIIDCEGSGRAFILDSGETADAVIDNFIIQNGKVNDEGGAVRCAAGASPTILNTLFQNNQAVNGYGGALYGDGRLTLINCIFNSNSASKGGGAIWDRDELTYINCVFRGNSAGSGGGAIGLSSKNGSSVFDKCVFSGNSAGSGGAIEAGQRSGTLEFTDCEFIGNSAASWGGGAVFGYLLADFRFRNCLFSGNSGKDGGVIYCLHNVPPTFDNCTLSGNSASNFGGAVYCDSHDITLTFDNSILWGNSATNGGNEIYINNSTNVSCTLNYCCVDNSGYGFATGVPSSTIDDSNHCIHTDPQFVDSANGDYRLKSASPCIDKGDNSLVPGGITTDLDGNPRITDGNNDNTATVDMGAYEYEP